MEFNHIGHLLTPEILQELDRLWPDRLPRPDSPDRNMLIACAQRDVINTLWRRYLEVGRSATPSQVIPSP